MPFPIIPQLGLPHEHEVKVEDFLIELFQVNGQECVSETSAEPAYKALRSSEYRIVFAVSRVINAGERLRGIIGSLQS